MLIAAMILFLTTVLYKIGNNSGLIPQWLGYPITACSVYIFYLIKREKNNNSQENNYNAENLQNNCFYCKILLAGFVIPLRHLL